MLLTPQVLLLLTVFFSDVQSFPSIGHFNTEVVHPSTEAYEINAIYVDNTCHPENWAYINPGSSPGIGMTLTAFEKRRKDGDVIGRAFGGSGKPDGSGFVALIKGWGGSKISYAETSWLNLNATDLLEYEMGWRWNLNIYGTGLVPQQNSKVYNFYNYFSEPPKVAVFVNAISQFWEKNFRFRTWADNISESGFTLHMDSWNDTLMSGAGTTWIAYPADKQSVASGQASTWDYRSSNRSRLRNGAHITFEPGTFSTSPQIFIGIQSFDIDQKHAFSPQGLRGQHLPRWL